MQKKVADKIYQKATQLSSFPEIGKVENQLKAKGEYRFLVEGDHKIIYSYESDLVKILTIYDTRQDPSKLKL